MKISRYISGLGVAVGLLIGSNALALPVTYNGHTYDTVAFGTWASAETASVLAGGHLVTINDAAEQAFLLSAFGSSTLYWIGFTDQTTEGVFQWISGQAVTYTNWNGGEPNDAGGEDYTVMNWGPSGRWNDLPTSSQAWGIYEVNSVPDGGSSALLLGLALCALGAGRSRLFKA